MEEILVYSLLPMKRNIGWGVAGLGCGSRIDVYLNWWSSHTGQQPVGAGIEGQ